MNLIQKIKDKIIKSKEEQKQKNIMREEPVSSTTIDQTEGKRPEDVQNIYGREEPVSSTTIDQTEGKRPEDVQNIYGELLKDRRFDKIKGVARITHTQPDFKKLKAGVIRAYEECLYLIPEYRGEVCIRELNNIFGIKPAEIEELRPYIVKIMKEKIEHSVTYGRFIKLIESLELLGESKDLLQELYREWLRDYLNRNGIELTEIERIKNVVEITGIRPDFDKFKPESLLVYQKCLAEGYGNCVKHLNDIFGIKPSNLQELRPYIYEGIKRWGSSGNSSIKRDLLKRYLIATGAWWSEDLIQEVYREWLKEEKFNAIKRVSEISRIPLDVDLLREEIVEVYRRCLEGLGFQCVRELNELTGRTPLDFEELKDYVNNLAKRLWEEGLYYLLKRLIEVTGLKVYFDPNEVNRRYKEHLKLAAKGELSHGYWRIIDLYKLTQIPPDAEELKDLPTTVIRRLIGNLAYKDMIEEFMKIFGRPDPSQLIDDMKEACKRGLEMGLYHRLEELEEITGLECKKIL